MITVYTLNWCFAIQTLYLFRVSPITLLYPPSLHDAPPIETGYLYDLAGNKSAPGTITITTDYSAPDAPTVALDPAEVGGDHITNQVTHATRVHSSGAY